MAASIFDSPMFVKSFPTGEVSRLFSDSAAVRAVLLVEGTLAKVQGELGLIPEDSAFFIHRSSMEVQIDPAGLAKDMRDENFVAATVKAFAKAMEAPEHSKFIHHDVAANEVEATALALLLRQFLTYCAKRVAEIDNQAIDTAALASALDQARAASIGLHMTTGLNVSKPLADALRLPLREEPADVAEVAKAAQAICEAMAQAYPNTTELTQLSVFCDGLTKMLLLDAEKMISLCLSQACLCAASALEISTNTSDR